MEWIEYNINDKCTFPPKCGRYLIYRTECDKIHFERWNGTGWAYSNNQCTHYLTVNRPIQNKIVI